MNKKGGRLMTRQQAEKKIFKLLEEIKKVHEEYNMSDLVSRQAAIDALAEAYEDIDAEWILKKLPAAQQWISVKERLPEFDELVLAWVENKDLESRFNRPGIYTAQLHDKEPKHDPEGKRNFWGIPGYDSEWTVWAWSYFSEPDVKAWQPLPEPYEEGNEVDNG